MASLGLGAWLDIISKGEVWSDFNLCVCVCIWVCEMEWHQQVLILEEEQVGKEVNEGGYQVHCWLG